MPVPRHAKLDFCILPVRLLDYRSYRRLGELGTINRKYDFHIR
jgi:hypothetical protein